MRAKRADIIIDRGPMEKIARNIFLHEMRILEDINGMGKVRIVNDDYPFHSIDYHMEYNRLARAYGFDMEKKMPRVEAVFGKFHERGIEKFYQDTHDQPMDMAESGGVKVNYEMLTVKALRDMIDDYRKRGLTDIKLTAGMEKTRLVEILSDIMKKDMPGAPLVVARG